MDKRNGKGQFAAGGAGGPGRPPRLTEASYLRVMMAKCDLAAWSEIVDAAVTAAKNGDASARAWLAKYLCGEPSTKAPDVLEAQALGELANDGKDPTDARVMFIQMASQ